MSEKLILHIGTHKTGTTALQAALAANESTLQAVGFSYPLMPETWPHIKRDRNAYWLSMAALQEIDSVQARHTAKIPACLEYFTQIAATSNKALVLSDERMWYCGTKRGYWEAVRDIVRQAGVDEVQIVVYLRRQDLFVESLWAQYVKGNTRLEKPLDEYLTKQKTLAVCDYAAGIKRLKRVFGSNSIIVRIYDRPALVGDDTVTDFLDVLGVGPSASIERPPASSNDSLSPSMTLLKLALNQTPEYKNAASNYLLATLAEVSRADDVKRAGFMTPEQRKVFLARYEAGNKQIAREFFGRDELFSVRDGELETEAFVLDADKLAHQTSEVIVKAVEHERRASEKKIAKLEKRIRVLESRESARLSSRLKRLIKRVFSHNGARGN